MNQQNQHSDKISVSLKRRPERTQFLIVCEITGEGNLPQTMAKIVILRYRKDVKNYEKEKT